MNPNEVPKPKPPVKHTTVAGKAEPPKEKPKYVRKPHLTDNPFRAHEGLKAMSKNMENLTPRKGRGRKKEKK